MPTHGLDHINIDTTCLEETIEFYGEVLGLDVRPKPSGKPGVWVYAGETAIVHVNDLAGQDVEPARATSRVNHVAFACSDLDGLREALDAKQIEYRVSRRDELGLTQIFTEDPNLIRVELNIAD